MNNFKYLLFSVCILMSAACAGSQSAKSPRDVMKTYVDGYNSRDTTAMRKTFSKDTVKMYEKIAQRNNTSIDEIINKQFEAAPANLQKLEVEIGIEEITGDEATVEAKNNTLDKSDKMPFVREDGQWKIALNKFVKNAADKN